MVTVYTSPMVVPGNQATTTFASYYFDSLHVKGIHTIKTTTLVASAQLPEPLPMEK